MKTKIIFTLFLLSGAFSYAQNKLFPQSFFDKKLAQEMLALGTSTIEGRADTKQKNTYGLNSDANAKHYAPQGSVVTLFPMTPYFEEFLKLRRQKENKKTIVYLSEEAFKYRLETKTDEYGRFKFEKLKPGKYYIECMVAFTAVGGYTQQTGVTTTYNGYGNAIASSPYYEKFFYNYDSANRETKIVEIKSEGELLEIKL
ncbi:hypothetical protein QFZ37_000682 [Chryseobacterium ginsenosidimutans]|uniref:hypothetical protein n=1 Tax=Chryseobacterium ginsenosidimutans TaxID=687846 RepID=UPI0027889934|nr:hypothetical protein [Chryseobacterium ginsenosidimutans]MDQ0592313.1 hypothetical protein [Chryseobacterium ginsenosidimutans]